MTLTDREAGALIQNVENLASDVAALGAAHEKLAGEVTQLNDRITKLTSSLRLYAVLGPVVVGILTAIITHDLTT